MTTPRRRKPPTEPTALADDVALEVARQLAAARPAPSVQVVNPPVVVAPWASIRKALAGGFGAVLAGVSAGLVDGHLSSTELWAAVGLGVAVLATVFRVPNADGKDGGA